MIFCRFSTFPLRCFFYSMPGRCRESSIYSRQFSIRLPEVLLTFPVGFHRHDSVGSSFPIFCCAGIDEYSVCCRVLCTSGFSPYRNSRFHFVHQVRIFFVRNSRAFIRLPLYWLAFHTHTLLWGANNFSFVCLNSSFEDNNYSFYA